MNKKLVFKNIKTLYGFDENFNFVEYNNVSLVIDEGKISKIIFNKEIEDKYYIGDYDIISCKNYILTPSFIDPHTHAVFAGTRENEFFMRLQGVPYLEIAKKGGGILSTLKSTREASEEELLLSLLKRLANFINFGVSHIEIKSGYGLSLKDELKLLRVINKAKNYTNLKIYPTLLAAHEFPPEYRSDTKKEIYIDIIINEIIPAVKEENLAIFFDIFSEEKVYNLKQTEKLLIAAKDAGFKLKLHSDELSNIGATELGIKLNATSVDHLLKINEKAIQMMKNSKTTPVLLPGTAFYINEPYPPYNLFKKYNVEVALASDFNPGTNYTENIHFIYTLAAIKLKMTEKEILKAATINAAKAIDLDNNEISGVIAEGYPANFNLLNAPNLQYIFYHYGINHVVASFINGEKIWIKGI